MVGNSRKRIGNAFIVVVIGCLIGIFVLMDIQKFIHYLGEGSSGYVGKVAGEEISYEQYKTLCDRYRQGRVLTVVEEARLRDFVWNELVNKALYSYEAQHTGVTVSRDELNDLAYGAHIDPAIMNAFKHPQTGAFDRKRFQNYLVALSNRPEEQAGWKAFEKGLAEKRVGQKLYHLIAQSYFITDLERTQLARNAQAFLDVDYLYIPSNTVNDDLVAITEQQLHHYMVAHRSAYQAVEPRKMIQYVTFPIGADERDQASFQKTLSDLMVQFSTTTDPYTFAQQHTDGILADTSLKCKEHALPEAVAKLSHTLKPGMVIGPMLEKKLHTLYKVVAIEPAADHPYQLAVIQKQPSVSERTRQVCLQKVRVFIDQVRSGVDLSTLAEESHLVMHDEQVGPTDRAIGAYAAARAVVRWLYTGAKVGEISDAFDVGDAYMVVVMKDQVEKGDLLPLSSLYYEVYRKVLHQEKAKLIVDRLKQMSFTTLQDIATAYEACSVTVKSVEGLNFLDHRDEPFRYANVFVGKCFGLKPHVVSDPIVDQKGVFIAYVKNKYSVEKAGEIFKDGTNRMQQERWRQEIYLTDSIKELVKMVDKRYQYE